MAGIELTNIKTIRTSGSFEHLAHERNTLVARLEVQEMLEDRGIFSVIERTIELSEDEMANALSNLADPEVKQDTFTIRDRKSQELIGMATLQPNLELRKQVLPIPVGLARKIGNRSIRLSKLFSERDEAVTSRMANVSAWVRPTPGINQEYEELYGVFKHLRSEATSHIWTLLPRSVRSAAAFSLMRAGYTRNTAYPAGWYDDLEVSGSKIPKRSDIFFARPITNVESIKLS